MTSSKAGAAAIEETAAAANSSSPVSRRTAYIPVYCGCSVTAIHVARETNAILAILAPLGTEERAAGEKR